MTDHCVVLLRRRLMHNSLFHRCYGRRRRLVIIVAQTYYAVRFMADHSYAKNLKGIDTKRKHNLIARVLLRSQQEIRNRLVGAKLETKLGIFANYLILRVSNQTENDKHNLDCCRLVAFSQRLAGRRHDGG